tara:strand:- start:3178 stop:3318 length:141 start_codon:yes stop_codon:yes gene_type:complete
MVCGQILSRRWSTKQIPNSVQLDRSKAAAIVRGIHGSYQKSAIRRW